MLGAVYKSTEIFMVQDKSEDFQETWEFLDRRVQDLSKVGKAMRNVSSIHILTHFSQETAKRVIGNQCRPRSDSASSQGLRCLH